MLKPMEIQTEMHASKLWELKSKEFQLLKAGYSSWSFAFGKNASYLGSLLQNKENRAVIAKAMGLYLINCLCILKQS